MKTWTRDCPKFLDFNEKKLHLASVVRACMCSRLIRSYVTLSFAICSIVTLTSFFFAVHLTYVSSITLEHHFLFSFFVDEDKWKTEARTELGAIQDYTISYQNLVPDTSYTFRVIAYNKYGISYPAKSNDEVSAYLCTYFLLIYFDWFCKSEDF